MSLVNVKCPNCGASIQLDNSREFGFCSYCGSKVQVQEAVHKIEIDKSGDIQSYIALSKASIEAGNGQEAYDYANKALELSSQNVDAWFLKMKALGLMATLTNFRCREIVTAGSKVLELDASEDRKINVYYFYLETCVNLLRFCAARLLNIDTVKEYYNSCYAVNPDTATDATLNFDFDMLAIDGQVEQIIAVRLAVSDSEIINNEKLLLLAEQIAVQWIEYQKALHVRLSTYEAELSEEAQEESNSIFNRIIQVLPVDKRVSIANKHDITEENMSNSGYAFEKPFQQFDGGTRNNNSNDNGGCYIATAVYGSYYAPEVLVLRHFRDHTLSKYYFGRLFIRIYYLLSPPVARRLRNATTVNAMVRSILDKWVKHLSEIQSKSR